MAWEYEYRLRLPWLKGFLLGLFSLLFEPYRHIVYCLWIPRLLLPWVIWFILRLFRCCKLSCHLQVSWSLFWVRRLLLSASRLITRRSPPVPLLCLPLWLSLLRGRSHAVEGPVMTSVAISLPTHAPRSPVSYPCARELAASEISSRPSSDRFRRLVS